MLILLLLVAAVTGLCLVPRRHTGALAERFGIPLPRSPRTMRMLQGVFFFCLIMIALRLKLVPFAMVLVVIAIGGAVMGWIKERLLDNEDLREDGPRAGSGQRARQGDDWRPPSVGRMEEAEALSVLGLQKGASAEEVDAAYRRLMTQIHPDKGGTDYLAGKLNEARDVLKRR